MIAYRVNVGGTMNVLEAARLEELEKVVYVSTNRIITSKKYEPIDEDHPVISANEEPGNGPYTASKLASEAFGLSYASAFGFTFLARALRDAGMEVIYTGVRQRPEVVAEAAVQEEVDVLGISMLSGAHMAFFPRILELLREKGAEGIMVIGGGVIPVDDVEELKRIGVREVFLPGTSTDRIVAFIKETVPLVRSEEDESMERALPPEADGERKCSQDTCWR